VEILSSYNFVIKHWEGKKNPADGPSKRPNYEIGYERPTARLLATLATTTVEPYDDLLQEIKTAQAIDALGADVKCRIVSTPIVDIPDPQRIDELEEDSSNEWKATAGVLAYEGRIYVPKNDLLRNKVISLSTTIQNPATWSSQNRRIRIPACLLARNGCHRTKIHCQM